MRERYAKTGVAAGRGEQAHRCRANGWGSLAAIASSLNEEQVPTAQGGRQWWPSTVRAVLRT